ncbi:hypothetical protein [Streptomyces spiramenti]|uniref:Integral membrane protein n=1 Tax=Streptomyces spiramenti TaxID=2720606 RepID=A0ABX1AJS6_9ACTN|nr:hypothetical protein [Streptomyces spiramenti]NJP66241.1 hypothetical protein [Streptomyces spiramenti]
MIRVVLRLYPRRYREDRGEEILHVHREMTEGASLPARAGELADITAHALRVRARVDSSAVAGRYVAIAAPFVVAAALITSGAQLGRWYRSVVDSPGAPYVGGLHGLALVAAVLVCTGGVAALTGRWAAGVGLLCAGLTGAAVAAVGGGAAYGHPLLTPAVAVLTAAVVSACPPDLRPSRGACALAGGVAAVGWLPLMLLYAGALPVSTEYGLWPVLVVVPAVLAYGLLAGGRWPAGASAVAVVAASPPLLGHAWDQAGGEYLAVALAVVGAAACVGLAVPVAARRRPRRRRVGG